MPKGAVPKENAESAAGSAGVVTVVDDETTDQWRSFASKKAGETVVLLTDPGKSEAAIAALIESSTLGMVAGDGSGHCIILYDSALSGEAITAPHIRSAPFRKEHFNKLANGVMAARRKITGETVCKLPQGDVFVFHDAGKPTTAELVSKTFIKD